MGETGYRPLTSLQRVRGGQQSGRDLAQCFQAEDTDVANLNISRRGGHTSEPAGGENPALRRDVKRRMLRT